MFRTHGRRKEMSNSKFRLPGAVRPEKTEHLPARRQDAGRDRPALPGHGHYVVLGLLYERISDAQAAFLTEHLHTGARPGQTTA